MARVKVPNTIDRFIRLPEESADGQGRPEVRLVRVEEVIAANLDELFPGKEVVASYVFQVTRNADFVIEEDEAADLLQAIEDEIEGRWFGQSVRLVVTETMPEKLREWLARNLKIVPGAVYAVPEPIGLADIEELTHVDRPDLLYPPLTPRVPPEIRNARSITSAVRQGRYPALPPFDSFAPVVEFVRAAANDPEVLAIKQTLYRVGLQLPHRRGALGGARRADAGRRARRAEGALRRGAEHRLGAAARGQGRARRLRHRRASRRTPRSPWSSGARARASGATCTWARATTTPRPPASTRTSRTSRTIPAIAEDVSDLFNYLTGYSEQVEYHELLVAPLTHAREASCA